MKKNEDQVTYGYKTKMGKTINIVFLDGITIKGTLLQIGSNELYVEVKDNQVKEVTIFKHAIKYIY